MSAPHPGRPNLATYLELRRTDAFRPARTGNPDVTASVRDHVPVECYRHLYDAVGSGFAWVDRLYWSDDELAAHLARASVTIMVLTVAGETAGYAELDAESDEPGTELRYLGFFPEFHGRGLGKHLLTVAVERAFADGADRIWLSTRATDGPHAITNYEKRGFRVYKTDWEPAPVHPHNAQSPDAESTE